MKLFHNEHVVFCIWLLPWSLPDPRLVLRTLCERPVDLGGSMTIELCDIYILYDLCTVECMCDLTDQLWGAFGCGGGLGMCGI